MRHFERVANSVAALGYVEENDPWQRAYAVEQAKDSAEYHLLGCLIATIPWVSTWYKYISRFEVISSPFFILIALIFPVVTLFVLLLSDVSKMKDSFVESSSTEAATAAAAFHTTNQDAADMARLGKAQQFQRNFSYWSTFGFVSIYMATWEYTILSMSPVLATTTGYGGFFWTMLGCTVCFASIVLSLAEMSSMSPTAGGQYHWVSEFAPARWQKEAAYASGWMSTLGWIASLSGSAYGCGNLVIVCVNLVQPAVVLTAWQLFLIILAFYLVTIALNTLGARVLPAMEVASLIGHTAGFVVFVGLLWGLCRPLNSGRDVFLSFDNRTGWSDYGAACLLAQVSIVWSMLGSDTIVHIGAYTDQRLLRFVSNLLKYLLTQVML